jgi:putative ABC transport system permease protein
MATFLSALRLALSAIARNKTRAVLTVLGILIGITAVVVVAALTESTSAAIVGKIDSLGANSIAVWPQPVQASGARARWSGRLTDNDQRTISREGVSIAAGAPFMQALSQVVYADKNVTTTIIGTTLPGFSIQRYSIAKGEPWTESDELLKTKVCVVGQTVATNLFGDADPIGRTIRIGRSPYQVVGLLASKGTSAFGDDQDDVIWMPVGSYRARIVHVPPGRADQLLFSATSDQTVDHARAQIESILRQRHRIAPGARDDFMIRTQADARERTTNILSMLSLFGLGVAAISLLVGGVGVMNIMLVSVAERTREIGIRMSIGARERDILVQFLVEAIALTLIGGVLGIVVGSAGAFGIGRALDLPMAPSAPCRRSASPSRRAR